MQQQLGLSLVTGSSHIGQGMDGWMDGAPGISLVRRSSWSGLVWSFSLWLVCLIAPFGHGMAWHGVHVDGSEWVCYFLRFFLSAGCVSFFLGVACFLFLDWCVALRCVHGMVHRSASGGWLGFTDVDGWCGLGWAWSLCMERATKTGEWGWEKQRVWGGIEV